MGVVGDERQDSFLVFLIKIETIVGPWPLVVGPSVMDSPTTKGQGRGPLFLWTVRETKS